MECDARWENGKIQFTYRLMQIDIFTFYSAVVNVMWPLIILEEFWGM